MTAREFLSARGHAAAAAASAFLLLSTATWAAFRDDPELAAAIRATRDASAALADSPPPALDRPDTGGILAAWSRPAIAEPAGRGEWVARPRPKIVPNVVRRKTAPDPDRKLPLATPGAPQAEAEPGGVHLEWPAPAAGKEAAPVTGIRILRRGPGDAAPVTVASLPGAARSWDDSAVAPKTSYEYRLQFLTTAPTPDGRPESALSPPTTAVTPADVALRYTGGSDDAALLIVRKCSGGEWREQTFTVQPRNDDTGQTGEIGGVERRTGADWRTGFVLLQIRRELFRFRAPVTHRHVDANGVLVQTLVMEDRQILRYRIAWLDDDGIRHELWMEVRLPAGAVPVE
ncbi:MAG: hypothetical protein HYY18_15855 [Planctomycetes bacterium]|nr:hypothetical protein [Planctomycetota bacterium]